MAVSKKISELPVLVPADAADLIAIVDVTDGVTKQTTVGSTAIINEGSTGAIDRTQESKNQEWVSVTDFQNTNGSQVLADGIQDDTTGVQAASDSNPDLLYFPGDCKITDKVTFSSGMRLVGSGRHNAGFVIEADFNLAATACIEFTGGEPGPYRAR